MQFSLDCAGKVNVATPRLPKNDPRRDALEKMLEENQPAKVIYTSSAFGQWLRHVDSISPTVPQDTIPADEFWSGRSYVTGDFEATITHLIGKAEGYAGGEVEQGREAVIVIGPPASGKSTLAATLAATLKAAIVDCDDCKPVIPEYGNGEGVQAVHDESSLLANFVLDRLMEAGANLTIPKVGKNPETLSALIDFLVDDGYRVTLVNVSVDPDECARRMARRFLETGRLVHPRYMEQVGSKPQETYELLIKDNRIRAFWSVDANGRPGELAADEPQGDLPQAFQGGRLAACLRPGGERANDAETPLDASGSSKKAGLGV